ncbi:hypothetical protein CW304_28940 [Bacillus sp. UFRGS-B20]|nr:hypothetical protein CW304_28940 [Bacillus sp. UFRGS-B20]
MSIKCHFSWTNGIRSLYIHSNISTLTHPAAHFNFRSPLTYRDPEVLFAVYSFNLFFSCPFSSFSVHMRPPHLIYVFELTWPYS